MIFVVIHIKTLHVPLCVKAEKHKTCSEMHKHGLYLPVSVLCDHNHWMIIHLLKRVTNDVGGIFIYQLCWDRQGCWILTFVGEPSCDVLLNICNIHDWPQVFLPIFNPHVSGFLQYQLHMSYIIQMPWWLCTSLPEWISLIWADRRICKLKHDVINAALWLDSAIALHLLDL